MDRIVNEVQQMCAKGAEADVRALYEKLLKAEEILARNAPVLDDVLATLDPVQHGVAWVAILRARASTPRIPDASRFVANTRNLVALIAPTHVSIACKEFCVVVSKAAEVLGDSGVPMAGISLVGDAIRRLNPRKGQVTTLHTVALKLCLLAHNYRAAMSFADQEVTSTMDASNSEALLCFFYYGGMAFVGMRRYRRALDMFRSALTVPASALSAVALEAYKKYMVVALIEIGSVPGLPRYAPTAIVRQLKSVGHQAMMPYSDLARAYETHDPAVVSTVVQTHERSFKSDGNMGIVKRAVQALPRHAVRRCTKTYLTLSLERIAQLANLQGGADAAASLVLDMVEKGEVNASISTTDGMVSFHDDSTEQAAVGERLAKQLEVQVRASFSLEEKLRTADQDISLSPQYIQRTQLRGERGGRYPSGGSEIFPGDDAVMSDYM